MPKSKVFLVRSAKVISSDGKIDIKRLRHLIVHGFRLVQKESGKDLFRHDDKVGIKINTLGGKKLSTRSELALSVAHYLEKKYSPRSVIIWDRTNKELKTAGYRLNIRKGKPLVFGTDTKGIGYQSTLVAHRSIGSRVSHIQSDEISASISLAILKDHGLAGITAGMKNYFGAIHNPNKYHDSHCNPFIPELFECPVIRKKHRLTILDGLIIQYHRGPAYHARWAERYGALIFSLDPVAADSTGWRLIEKIRAEKGLPSLKKEDREPVYIQTAAGMGLGSADPDKIQVTEEEE